MPRPGDSFQTLGLDWIFAMNTKAEGPVVDAIERFLNHPEHVPVH
jgi:hypothetical protein